MVTSIGAPDVRAFPTSLAYALARYRRSAVTRAHRISGAPREVSDEPCAMDTPSSQPYEHTAILRSGRPLSSHATTTPSSQRTPSSEQTSAGPARASSRASKGRAIGASGRQSCVPASGPPITSRSSTTHPRGHRPISSQGHSQAPPVHGCGTWPAREASMRPSAQRSSPSEQSVPARSHPPPLLAAVLAPFGPGSGLGSSCRRRQPRSHAATRRHAAARKAAGARTTPW